VRIGLHRHACIRMSNGSILYTRLTILLAEDFHIDTYIKRAAHFNTNNLSQNIPPYLQWPNQPHPPMSRSARQ
jgi:hypothetical protein